MFVDTRRDHLVLYQVTLVIYYDFVLFSNKSWFLLKDYLRSHKFVCRAVGGGKVQEPMAVYEITAILCSEFSAF